MRRLMQSKLRLVQLLMSGLSLALAAAPSSFAATTWTVTSTNDDGGLGTLRAAIAGAQTGDTVVFQSGLSGTIVLQSTLMILNSITIQGPGAGQLAVSGNKAVQVFYIQTSGSPVTISGLTIENGANPGNLTGGGIYNERGGTLMLTNITVSGNSSNQGGGTGGGIYNAGTLTIENSTISGNSAGAGGGIYSHGTLTLTNSTVFGNSSNQGGGIWNSYSFTMTNSTVSGNLSALDGGGMFNAGTLTMTNSTVFGNTSFAGDGGAILNGGTLTATNGTISGNSAGVGGGGIYISQGALLTLKSTLLAGNQAGNCHSFGTGTSMGYNLSDDSSCAGFLTATGDTNDVSAGLDSKGLQKNGGPTQTVALLATSPAVDAIPLANCTATNGAPVTTDQRGVSRPQSKGCDIGAYELIQTVPFSSFTPHVAVHDGPHPGFVITATFTLWNASTGLQPANETMTLQIANYTLILPAGSFHQLSNAPDAPYTYSGNVNGADLLLHLIPRGNDTFAFDATGAPVAFSDITNPVTITLAFGNDFGTARVTAH